MKLLCSCSCNTAGATTFIDQKAINFKFFRLTLNCGMFDNTRFSRGFKSSLSTLRKHKINADICWTEPLRINFLMK